MEALGFVVVDAAAREHPLDRRSSDLILMIEAGGGTRRSHVSSGGERPLSAINWNRDSARWSIGIGVLEGSESPLGSWDLEVMCWSAM